MNKAISTYSPHLATALVLVLILMSMTAVENILAETRYLVRSSDSLDRIVKRHYPGSKLSKSELMRGVYEKNPKAFKDGNINVLLKGKRLVLPDAKEIEKELEQKPEAATEQVTVPIEAASADVANATEKAAKSGNVSLTDQQKQIGQLQKDSQTLKLKLEALADEKNQRDQRLLELEKSLKNSLKQKAAAQLPAPPKKLSVAPSEKTVTKLKEVNRQLLRKLQKTQTELAKKSQVTIDLEQEVIRLKSQLQMAQTSSAIQGAIQTVSLVPKSNVARVETSLADTAKSTANRTAASLETAKEAAAVEAESKINGILNTSPEPQPRPEPRPEAVASTGTESHWKKLFWLLPLVLLGLLLHSYFRKPKEETELDYSKQIEEAYLEQQQEELLTPEEIEEDVLETSIKLDVARAYIEAEDTESALDILNDIMKEGSGEQREQARLLLDGMAA